ncbi:peptide chain release factor N(5)-glutamine methyltransferase [Sorangium sp. So ce341]|uniref:peptide chain release factor N(5)-glutamine methyltransferase n=1 Tax=Sorangium sp. So ce341 TaxID=3133302 RepID=UPI003F5E13FE
MTKPDVEPQNEPWTIRRVIAWASGDLRKRGASSARLDAELLLGKVLGIDRVGLLIDAERPLDRAELAAYRELHQRRRAGEPVAYLLGVREFYGRPFRVDPRVLIPRPDTEILVEVGLSRTRQLALSARVLDLCTGSGCVAVSLACERPTSRVLGIDISDGALAVARENALRLGAVNAGFLRSDLFAGVPSGLRFDLITANPPYIPDQDVGALQVDIRGYEPHLALAGGADGLAFTRRIVAGAPARLAGGGVLAVEVEAGKAGEVAELFAAAGFVDVARNLDYGGHERVVSGVLP